MFHHCWWNLEKTLSEDVLAEINEMIINFNNPDDLTPSYGGGSDSDDSVSSESENAEIMILDATCAQQSIKYPQDLNVLNEERNKLVDFST